MEKLVVETVTKFTVEIDYSYYTLEQEEYLEGATFKIYVYEKNESDLQTYLVWSSGFKCNKFAEWLPKRKSGMFRNV